MCSSELWLSVCLSAPVNRQDVEKAVPDTAPVGATTRVMVRSGLT